VCVCVCVCVSLSSSLPPSLPPFLPLSHYPRVWSTWNSYTFSLLSTPNDHITRHCQSSPPLQNALVYHSRGHNGKSGSYISTRNSLNVSAPHYLILNTWLPL
jgi:hypothetical protein